MSTARVSLLLATLTLGTVITIGVLSWPCGEPTRAACWSLSSRDLRELLRRRGVVLDTVDCVRPTKDRSGVFVVGLRTGRAVCVRASFLSDNVQQQPAPSRVLWIADNGSFIAWRERDGKSIVLRNGSEIALPPFGLFDADETGQYFCIGEKPSRAWIGRLDQPDQRTLLANDLLANRVFVDDGRILLCGTSFTTNRVTGTITACARCLVMDHDAGGFHVRERHDLTWASGVIDKDPRGARLLAETRGDSMRHLCVYHLATRSKVRGGRSMGVSGFLPQVPVREPPLLKDASACRSGGKSAVPPRWWWNPLLAEARRQGGVSATVVMCRLAGGGEGGSLTRLRATHAENREDTWLTGLG